MIPIIESKLTHLEMQIEHGFMNPPELRQPGFSDGPEVLDPINVITSVSEFILPVPDPVMLFIAQIDQTVIRFEPISIYD